MNDIWEENENTPTKSDQKSIEIEPRNTIDLTKVELKKNECKDIGKWSTKEIEILKRLYPRNAIIDNDLPDKTNKQIQRKANRLGLKINLDLKWSNKKFSNLTIVKLGERLKGRRYVYCKCDCGNLIYTRLCHITERHTKSCGCLNKIKESGEKHHSWKGYGNISGIHIYRIKNGADTRNIVFDLDAQYLDKLLISQDFKCSLSGLPIFLLKANGGTASLDRIDSLKGYIIGNVQWVHKDVNKMKNNFEQSKFIDYCKLIASK